jgi:hypothetical protein
VATQIQNNSALRSIERNPFNPELSEVATCRGKKKIGNIGHSSLVIAFSSGTSGT